VAPHALLEIACNRYAVKSNVDKGRATFVQSHRLLSDVPQTWAAAGVALLGNATNRATFEHAPSTRRDTEVVLAMAKLGMATPSGDGRRGFPISIGGMVLAHVCPSRTKKQKERLSRWTN
jgi:hypothetical protein